MIFDKFASNMAHTVWISQVSSRHRAKNFAFCFILRYIGVGELIRYLFASHLLRFLERGVAVAKCQNTFFSAQLCVAREKMEEGGGVGVDGENDVLSVVEKRYTFSRCIASFKSKGTAYLFLRIYRIPRGVDMQRHIDTCHLPSTYIRVGRLLKVHRYRAWCMCVH